MDTKQIQLIKGAKSYKLTVTENLEKQIRFMCDFKEGTLHIICKDFFLQDIGASTYTEFKNDVDLAGYVAAHSLWDCYMGLIHSHNTMSKQNCFIY